MAELDPDGPQLPPWGEFRFHGADLESWFDGQKRILARNVDFPPDAPLEEVKRRLEQAAHKRRGRARIWKIDPDRIGVLLMPPWTG
jgi:hypothetical protein